MPGTTPIYSFPYPVGTDPVKDGASSIQSLATAVETTVSGLSTTVTNNAAAVGLIAVASASFSNVTSFDVTGFTATYEVYELVVNFGRYTGSAASSSTTAVLMSGGVSTYNTGYYGAGWYVDQNGGTGATGARNNGANMLMPYVYSTASWARMRATIGGMNTTAQQFSISGSFYDPAVSGHITFGYQNTGLTLSLDRIRFSNAAAMVGKWMLYGYKNS